MGNLKNIDKGVFPKKQKKLEFPQFRPNSVFSHVKLHNLPNRHFNRQISSADDV